MHEADVTDPRRSFDLSGKTALVTGSSRGIGAAVRQTLSRAGARVIGCSRTENVDLSDREQWHSLPDEVDILVNCAARQTHHPAIGFPMQDWRAEIDLNLTATFELCQRVAPNMIRRGWGRIVNFTSIAGIQGTRGIVAYSVSKAGVIELTKCLSNEWSPFGVTVNCIAPGHIETDMLKPLLRDFKAAETIKGRIPIGRFGVADDVATAAQFLCSSEASYISGIVLPVDGGWLAR